MYIIMMKKNEGGAAKINNDKSEVSSIKSDSEHGMKGTHHHNKKLKKEIKETLILTNRMFLTRK